MSTPNLLKPPSILVIDDEPDNFDVIETLLYDENYQLHYLASGEEAIALMDSFEPDLILLDVMMPNMDGRDVCQQLKTMPKYSSVPIIIVTALQSNFDLAECFNYGADDFIRKPVNSLELRARVRSMLRIREQYKQIEHFNTMLQEVVSRKTENLQKTIFQDELTKLPSRKFLLQKLTEIVTSSKFSFALIYLNCDQFKLIHSSFGYKVSNELLISIAQRLKKLLRNHDMLAHIGQDEFCFVIKEITNVHTLEPFLQDIFRSFDKPFLVAGCEIFMSACMGIILGNNNQKTQTPEELLHNADAAMYQAKKRGKGNYQIFNNQIYQGMLKRLTLENDLLKAFKQNEFINYYQPIINIQTQKLEGFEALVRWEHHDKGLILPKEFIPSLETSGLIIPLGIEVLQQACQQLKLWHQQGFPELTISVNLSVRQFASSTLIVDIDRVLVETGINPIYLQLEITESAIMDNPTKAINLIKQLKSRGIKISIDDFGTGYSSLAYLQDFSLDNLKIDSTFIHDIESKNNANKIVETIIYLSNQLDVSLTAEGIETNKQLEFLTQLNCEFGQGYLFCEPLPPSKIDLFIFDSILI